MRIIGGTAAGRLLKVPKGFNVRPTPDLVKQAVFNSLGNQPEGAQVLELFAGSGALGLECLSRGASNVTAVELSRKHAGWIRANLAEAGLSEERFEMRVQDVFIALRQLAAEGRRFDLILADPPFGEKTRGHRSESLSQKLLDDPSLAEVMESSGLFVLGHTHRDEVQVIAPWEEVKLMRHGDSVMRFLTQPATS